MLTQNKKIIIFAVVTLLIILIMLVFVVWMIEYLTQESDKALNYDDKDVSNKETQGFNFEGLKNLGIKEINDILIATSTPASTTPTSTSTSATSTVTSTTTSTDY